MEHRMQSPSSLKTKLKSSIRCFVGGHQHQHQHHARRRHHEALQPAASRSSPSEKPQQMARSPTVMFRSLISFLGARSTRCHCYPTDFSYDPSSYALNFDDGQLFDDSPLRTFSARLPPSPSPAPLAFAVACG